MKRQWRGQAMRPINRTLEVLFRETYFLFQKSLFMTSSHCPSKETEVPEVVGTLTLVITLSKTGEPRPSSYFREFISLNFLSFISYLRD